MRELRSGLWHWRALHPDWTPDEGGPGGWEQEVSSYLLETDEAVLLFDPLLPEDPTAVWRAIDGAAALHVLLTCFWHARSSPAVLERRPDARVWSFVGAADEARKRVQVTNTFELADSLPGGIEARPAAYTDEVVFWLPGHRAIVAGDVLRGSAAPEVHVQPDSWLAQGVSHEELRDRLRPLLDLPLELVLLAHGQPVDDRAREALERALET